VQHGQRGARGSGATEELAPRDFVIPQLSHECLLKHVLGATKNSPFGQGDRAHRARPAP
jgi:hypothetical protein